MGTQELSYIAEVMTGKMESLFTIHQITLIVLMEFIFGLRTMMGFAMEKEV